MKNSSVLVEKNASTETNSSHNINANASTKTIDDTPRGGQMQKQVHENV